MLKRATAGLFFLLLAFAGCQTPDTDTENTTEETIVQADTVQQQARPKPEFFSIPPELARKRVYICMDNASDTFHQKHDCPVLITCKSTFRNLTLTRSIEDFDRYNCQTCSSDLAHIFDEDTIRMETGLGNQQ